MDSPALLQYLKDNGITFSYHEHVAVFTSQQARDLIEPLPGASAKNLFLRNKKGDRHFLLTVDDRKTVNLKSLAASQGISGLSLASPERLMAYLSVTPGAVSLMALVNDPQGKVEVLIDLDLWSADALHAHPLVNTATLVISLDGIKTFLSVTRHLPKLITI
ncbi:MAG: prolyl-tRNA synthetase associated domain-containing protein [Chloroflexi bacterium]|nr:prolyl-tRNA synthetase associated domain-containing protein [Chloroflexota bacterium]